ncbi:hypothetical protein FQZ97_1108830 [compost metagenome]
MQLLQIHALLQVFVPVTVGTQQKARGGLEDGRVAVWGAEAPCVEGSGQQVPLCCSFGCRWQLRVGRLITQGVRGG